MKTHMRPNWAYSYRLFACFLALCLLTTTQSCAPMSSRSPKDDINAQYYPQCYQPCADLKQSQASLEKSVALGLFSGAALGGIFGIVTTGNIKGLAVGAAAGGIAGGIGGYYMAKMQQHKEDAARFMAYRVDMDAEMLAADRTERYALAALRCYARAFEDLLAEMKINGMNKEESQARYNEIKAGVNQVGVLLAKAKDSMLKQDEEFRNVFAEEAKLKNQTPPAVASLDSRREQRRKEVELQVKSTNSKAQKKNPQKNKSDGSMAEYIAQMEQHGMETTRPGRILESGPTSQATRPTQSKPNTIDEVSKTYANYADSIIHLEELGEQHSKLDLAMQEQAQKAGIDNV